jgi:anthranilate synthase/phosphoribosyltransferase
MYLLIDNYDSFTWNIYQYLTELTPEEIRVVRNDRITLDEVEAMRPAGIIISPGPGRPEDAGISVDAILRFAGKIPILGVCLGHQAIGHAFGGKIVGAGKIMHGKTDSIVVDGRGLFRTVPSPAVFTRYHSLVIDPETLPECLEITARSTDGAIMGVRHREYLVEGVQFHPESVASESGREVLKNFLTYRREPVPHRVYLDRIIGGRDLTMGEAADFMRELTEGSLPEAIVSAYLVALNAKGITPAEIAGCASILGEKRRAIEISKPVLDTCGTGGDGLGTFNISSLAAIVAASCGAAVAKHGNRAVSSLCGSADFYRELGIAVDLSPESSVTLVEETGFAFLFAPIYHGAMRHAAPVRRTLGLKTIMNLLGPLVNPAGAKYQLIGVYDEALVPVMAEAAGLLGIQRALVVHGSDGLDEITVTGKTTAVSVGGDGKRETFTIDPVPIIGRTYPIEELAGGAAPENARVARELVAGTGPEAIFEAVCLNAGAALRLYGSAEDLASGYALAKAAFESGRVGQKLEEIIARSNELSAKQGA